MSHGDITRDLGSIVCDICAYLSSVIQRSDEKTSMFSGFNSWTNSVHSYQCIVTMLNASIRESNGNNSIVLQKLIDFLGSTITGAKVEVELGVMISNRSWASPHALCRFAKFMALLYSCPPQYSEWARKLTPILNEVEKFLERWIVDLQRDPFANVDKNSTTANTAHCFTILLEACELGVCSHLYVSVGLLAQQLYGGDGNKENIGMQVLDDTEGILPHSLSVATLVVRLHELGSGIQQDGRLLLLDWLHKIVDLSVWKTKSIEGTNNSLDTVKANFIIAHKLFRIASVLLSDWDVCSIDSPSIAPLSSSIGKNASISRSEMISRILDSAKTLHTHCMQIFGANSDWKDTEVACHAFDSATAFHQATIAVSINTSWLQQTHYLRSQRLFEQFESDSPSRGWRNVKVWVCSVASDSQAERKIIFETVFPLLNEWAKPYRIRVIPCDSAVSSDIVTSKNVIRDMLHCKESNNGALIVLSLLGDSYGDLSFTTSPDQIVLGIERASEGGGMLSQEQPHEKWAEELSLLHLVILHGTLQGAQINPHALFFLRRRNVCHGNVQIELTDPFETSEKLRHLKQHIRLTFPKSAVMDYEYDPNMSLIEFSSAMLESLKARLSSLYCEKSPLCSDKLLRDEHEWQARKISKAFVGRQIELTKIHSYLCPSLSEEEEKNLENEANIIFTSIRPKDSENIWKNDAIAHVRKKIGFDDGTDNDIWRVIVQGCPTVRSSQTELDDWEFAALHVKVLPLWSHVLVVAGDNGTGRTSLLCKAATSFMEQKQAGDDWLDSVVHLSGVGTGSESVECVVRRIGKVARGDDFTMMSTTSNEDIRRMLWDIFIDMYTQGKKLAIFIDDVDCLASRERDGGIQSLAWLPYWLPPSVKIVVTVSASSSTYQLLEQQLRSRSYIYRIPRIGTETSERFVNQYLHSCGKTWKEADLACFLMNPMCTTNFQYLLCACDEMMSISALESFEDEVLCLPHDLSNMHYLKIDKAVEKGGAKMFLTLCVLSAVWPLGLDETILMRILCDGRVLKELYTDPWPGGSVPRCESLDAFFNSARTTVIETAKSGTFVKAGQKANGKAQIRRAFSDGDVCVVDPSIEEDICESRLLRAAEDDTGLSSLNMYQIRPYSTALAYRELCVIMEALRGLVGLVDRSGVVNILHTTFNQAIRDYCIQFDDDEGSTVNGNNSSKQRPIMRRQTSLERKYFSSSGKLLFKRKLKYFNTIVDSYQTIDGDKMSS